MAADCVAVIGSGFAAILGRFGTLDSLHELLPALLLAVILTAQYTQLLRAYEFVRPLRFPLRLRLITVAWAMTFGTLILLAFLTKRSDEYSRIFFTIWATLSWVGLLANRLVATRLISSSRAKGALRERVLLVGLSNRITEFLDHMHGHAPHSLNVVGVIPVDGPGSGFCDGHPCFAIDDFPHNFVAAGQSTDSVLILLPWRSQELIEKVMSQLRGFAVDIHFLPESLQLPIPMVQTSHVGGIPTVFTSMRPLSGADRLLKGLEDKLISTIALAILAPLMAVIALAVKLDSRGPVLFKQPRHGFNNQQFKILKFRTMYANSDPEGAVPQATRGDPRVTRVGRLLRSTSLDELPQLFNVLMGQMSLVGPRPHAVAHNNHFGQLIDGYLGRHRVKPGITGWAQVNGLRGETDTLDKMTKRIEQDLYYIQNWTFWFDIKILFLTLFAVFVDDNAY